MRCACGAGLLLFCLAAWGLPARAQQLVSGRVVDPAGGAIAGARVEIRGMGAETRSAADGTFHIEVTPPATLDVSAPGFADAAVRVAGAAAAPVRVLLQPRGIVESITVAGGTGRRLASPASVSVIDAEALASAPAFALDDQLRSIPGFSLFRRSSSRVANPTTQGVTLRGIAASGASRAAVLADGAPLNDPFGGWVHWMRVPIAAIERVEVARGGASDLFGADAVGGAITIDLVRAGLRVFADGGQQGTARASVFAGRELGAAALRGGAERFTTDGFVTVAPGDRGAIDTPAWSRHGTLFGGARLPAQRASHVDLRGGYVSERRGNGTPFQANRTTARHAAATMAAELGPGLFSVRVNGTSQEYEQTFSAVAADRASERPTNAQRVAATSAGLAVEWVQPWRSSVVLVAASGREVGVELTEQALSVFPAPVPALTRATERSGALTAQISRQVRPRITVSAGARGEVWKTARRREPGDARLSFGPRASIAYQASGPLTLRAALQSGYRFPTMNELFRGFRVGSIVTRANAELGPEHSLGIEGAALLRHRALTARAAAFWTRVNDAIVNVTLDSAPGAILRQRRNAARVSARGVELETEIRASRVVTLTAAAGVIRSTFGGSEELRGLRVPQVPTMHASAGARAAWRIVTIAGEWRFTGRQFDDDRNRFSLDPASIVDVRAGVRPRRGLEIFVAMENLFDEEQDVGRTPLRTIGAPRSARVGLRLRR